MKNQTRRQFISTAVAGGATIANLSLLSSTSCNASPFGSEELKFRYDKLDQVLKQPILKKELFSSPVIIQSLELLQYNRSYLCRVRSKDGAEGISVAHNSISTLYPIFMRNLRSFFIGQDARELDLILEKVYYFNFNFRYNGMALGLPLATIEFAILDMLGKIANKPVAQLIGEIHNPEVGLYMATELRELPLEEHFERIKREVSRFDVNALKIKIGYLFANSRDIHDPGLPGKSEKLIPMVREYYGDDFALYADSNGYYDVDGAIKIGRLLEEYNYRYFEEPVLYWHFEETKKVADALTIPIAHGEQDQNLYNFRWLLANDGIDIVEPDTFYFGGFIRSMRVALMAQAVGKTCITHMSAGGLGFYYNAVFVSAVPNAVEHHEFRGFETNVPYECPTAPMVCVNSKMKAPTGIGMGYIIDPEFIEKHEPVRM